jgi:FeS assembly SUF system protein
MGPQPGQRLNLPMMGDTSAPAAPAVPDGATLEERVVAAVRSCYDPEIPINVYDLGLIYELKVDDAGAVNIKMTLTSPACPVAGALPLDVQRRVAAVPGVTKAVVDLVWDPPWDKDRMSEEAQLQLGLF